MSLPFVTSLTEAEVGLGEMRWKGKEKVEDKVGLGWSETPPAQVCLTVGQRNLEKTQMTDSRKKHP